MPLPTSKESSPAPTTIAVTLSQTSAEEDPGAKQPSNADSGNEGPAANQEDSPTKTEKTEEGKYEEEDVRDNGLALGGKEADKDIDVSGSGDDAIEQQNTQVLESIHFCFLHYVFFLVFAKTTEKENKKI